MPFLSKSSSAGRFVDRRMLLEKHSLFGQLDPHSIERLCSFARIDRVRRNHTIFTKGDVGNSLFAVCSGTVKISVPSADGRESIFNLVSEGGIFGEIALLDGQPRTADARAISDCELMVIDRRDFVPLLRSQPDIALKIIEVLCARIRHTSEQVEIVMFLDLPARLAKTLLRLAEGVKPSTEGRKIVITQREIGQLMGLSRESTNKQLRSWEQRSWVRLERGGVIILAPEALAQIAEHADD